jgi:hypothetical protein
MPTLREKFKDAQARVKPEKLAISTSIAGISIFSIVPLQSLLTLAIHEAGEEYSTSVIKILAIALIGIAGVSSIAVETKVLKEKEYSASILGTTIHIATGNSLTAAISDHMVNYLTTFGINPVHAFNIAAAASGDGGRLFYENASAVAITLAAWNIVFNTLIWQNSADKVVNTLQRLKAKV